MINNQLAVKGGMCCMFVGSKAKMDFMLLSKRVSAHYSLGHRRHCIWDKIGKEHEGVTLIFFFLSLSFCTKLVVSLAYIYVTSRKVPPQLRDEAKNGWEGDKSFWEEKLEGNQGGKHRKDIICSYPGQNVCTVFHLFQNLDTRSVGQIFLIVQQSTNTINRA